MGAGAAGAGGEAGQAASEGAAGSGQQGQAAAAGQAQSLDANSFYKIAESKGEEKAQKATESWLKSTFGTADRVEIEKLAKKKGDGASSGESSLPQSVLDQINNLQKENDTLKGRIQSSSLTESIQKEIGNAGFNLHNNSVTLKLLTDEYDFRELNGEMVAHRKGSDQPVIIDNRFATIKGLLTGWAKDASYSFLFQNGQRVTMPQTGAGASGGRMEAIKEGELANPDFVQALKRSGQFYAALNKQPIDRDKVEHFMPRTK